MIEDLCSRALITGAAGVIGRQLTRRLAEQGVEILTIDREPMPSGFDTLSQHIQDDLSTMDLDSIATFDPQQTFHLAASFERTTESSAYWDIGWRDDVTASHRIISAAAECPSATVFVFASSYLVYDENLYLFDAPPADAVALREDTRVDPRNLCGAGKYYTERELRYTMAVRRSELRVCNARIYRVYGEGSRDVISRWVRALLAGEKIEVFNAANIFDYVYASDVAEALARLGRTHMASGVFNVATGQGTRITDVVAALSAAGLETSGMMLESGEQAPYEASVADVSRLKDVLGWVPSTDIAAGVRHLVDYERG